MARRPPMTIGRYLVQRLDEIGVGHVFGVPGDYVLTFMDRIVESSIELVGTCNELNAGYAADAYARINRVGAVCVTYAVGGFSVLNAIAGAYAERVPLIVISGGPSLADRRRGLLLHHTLGDFNAQADIFAKVTIASTVLTDAALAPAQIDRIFAACLRHKRPVFIEIPEDLVDHPCLRPEPFRFEAALKSDPAVCDPRSGEPADLDSAGCDIDVIVWISAFESGRMDPQPALSVFRAPVVPHRSRPPIERNLLLTDREAAAEQGSGMRAEQLRSRPLRVI